MFRVVRPKWCALAIASLCVGLACEDPAGDDGTVASVLIVPNPVQLLQRDSVQLVVTAQTASGATVPGVTFTFATADAAVASVTPAGRVRSGDVRSTTSIAVTGGGQTVQVAVTVSPRITSLAVTPNPILLNRRDSANLVVTALDVVNAPVAGVAFTFASSDTTKVIVSSLGRVKARDSLGTAQVTVTGGGLSRPIPATVNTVPVAVQLTPPETVIPQGTSVQFAAEVVDQFGLPAPGPAITYESSSPGIVAVTTGGLASAAGPLGNATITAHSGVLTPGASPVEVIDSNLIWRTRHPGTPYGAAISAGGIAFITLLTGSQVARAVLPQRTFGFELPIGNIPTDVGFNGAGTRAYVANQFSQTIGVVNVTSHTALSPIPVSGDPFKVFVAPGDSILWVTTNRDSIYAIRLATGGVITRFPAGATANGFAARDSLIWVATRGGGTVIEINAKTYTVIRTLNLGGLPQDLALSANGQQLYVANEAGSVQIVALPAGTFTSVALPVGGGYGMALRASNNLLYVGNSLGGVIHVVNPATRTLTRTILAGGTPRRVAFNATGTVGIVTNENGWIDFLK